MPPGVLVQCDRVSKAYGARTLFEGVSLTLFEGDRVGLVGPNGSGKTSLMRIVAGEADPDDGTRTARRGLSVGFVAQDPVFPADVTVEEVLARAALARGDDPNAMLGAIAVALGRAGFTDPRQPVDVLSGGWRKRLAIARELVHAPDLLLLDEPTNHLDLEGILWLERLLASAPFAFVAVSHDRSFLEHVASRVVELNRVYPGGAFAVDGRYTDFLEQRQAALSGQATYRDALANTVRREIEWLRRGPKARTTKAEARIREAERKIDELAALDERIVEGRAEIDFAATERRTRRLVVTRGLGKSYGDRTVVENLDLVLSPGARLGVLGPNGSGKSTLLGLLAGRIAPDRGRIERAAGLRTVLFEQDRSSLDPDATLRRALAPEGDTVVYRGRETHVAGWAQRFLFRTDQLDTEVRRLSGGEQARILIARLMLQPADVLILDEPTNDLDIPTLEVLEDSLLDFPGALVLVTHDRVLLDTVSNRLLALDGRGGAVPFADYAQWEAAETFAAAETDGPKPAPRPRTPAAAPPKKKLSWREEREWEGMEARIAGAEDALSRARAAVEDPAVASDAAALQERLAALARAEADVDALFERWAELEAKRSGE